MFHRISAWLMVGLIAAILSFPVVRGYSAAAQQSSGPLTEVDDLKQASVKGKYSNLLTVISVPADKANYGEFYDYGHYTGTSWAGYSGLPQGYWVYVYPRWYIWGNQKGAAAPAGNAIPNGDVQKASVNGKYANLLKVINVPQDKASYQDFTDYGYYTGTSWAGYNNLPPGYWVYVYPNWYIWGKQN